MRPHFIEVLASGLRVSKPQDFKSIRLSNFSVDVGPSNWALISYSVSQVDAVVDYTNFRNFRCRIVPVDATPESSGLW